MADLEGYGLHELVWESCDDVFAGALVASPADAEGRGIALAVRRDGEVVDLSGANVYLLWRHRATRERGCEPFDEVDAETGTFSVFYPAAMVCAEGSVDCQVMVSLPGGSALSTRTFEVRVEQVLVGGAESEDGFTLFLEAIQKYENADALIAEAASKAQGTSLRNKGARGQVAPLLNHPSYNGLHYVRFKFQEASMFGVPTQEVVVIVEARGCGKYSKQLYNLIGTNDDEGEVIVGPRDGSVQASIFDERKFVDNQLSSEQKVIFIGNPKFARDYLDALDSLATDQFDEHGIHIRIGGKHASVSVDSGGVTKETYWSFLDYAASRGCEFPDLLSALRDSTLPVSEESDGDRSGKNKIGVFFGGIAKGARGVVGGASDKAMLLRKASAIEDQKFQFAIRLFYLDKLRAFVEG